MCYYALISGDTAYNSMITAAGTWLLARQVNNANDERYGLLKGGFDDNGEEIPWCSTENNVSAIQALQGLALLTTGTTSTNYTNATNLIIDRLKPLTTPNPSRPSLYHNNQNRYYQGVNDDGWALDCCTWAGSTAKNLLPSSGITPNRDQIATNCRSTASSNFLVTGISSFVGGVYGGYSLSGSVKGFKPFANSGDPSFVWTEGTLGFIHLCMLLGLDSIAIEYMDETIKLQNCKTGQNGVLYSTHRVTSQGTEFRIWESVVSSAWLYLLINNPFVLFPPLHTPLASISGNNIFYNSAIFTLNNAHPGTVTWEVTGPFSLSSAAGNSITVTKTDNAGKGVLIAKVNGYLVATANITAMATLAINGPSQISSGGYYSYYLPIISGATYSWSDGVYMTVASGRDNPDAFYSVQDYVTGHDYVGCTVTINGVEHYVSMMVYIS